MNNEKKTLILHVGFGKTGTSFIQENLAANESNLATRGICYPKTARAVTAAGHHQLISTLADKPQWWMVEKTSDDALFNALFTEIQSVDPRVVILSQESLIWLSYDRVHFLGVKFADFNVKIVIDLRKQDLYVDSALNQIIKSAGHRCSFEAVWRSDVSWAVPDYYAQTKKWANTFGGNAVVIRPFEKSQFLGSNLLDDFLLRTLGFTLPLDIEHSAMTQNDRLSRRSLEFKRLMNRLFFDAIQVTDHFVGLLIEVDRRLEWKDYSIVNNDIRRSILHSTLPQNKNIYNEFNYVLYDGSAALRENIFTDPFQPSNINDFDGLAEQEINQILSHIAQIHPGLLDKISNQAEPADLDEYDQLQIRLIKYQISQLS